MKRSHQLIQKVYVRPWITRERNVRFDDFVLIARFISPRPMSEMTFSEVLELELESFHVIFFLSNQRGCVENRKKSTETLNNLLLAKP